MDQVGTNPPSGRESRGRKAAFAPSTLAPRLRVKCRRMTNEKTPTSHKLKSCPNTAATRYNHCSSCTSLYRSIVDTTNIDPFHIPFISMYMYTSTCTTIPHLNLKLDPSPSTLIRDVVNMLDRILLFLVHVLRLCDMLPLVVLHLVCGTLKLGHSFLAIEDSGDLFQ